ncbi:MAG: diphthine--ammonia ligase [Bacteroidota bacterium]
MQHKTYFNWSSGKDSAMALHQLLKHETYEVHHLLTAVNTHHNRVSMHGVRRELLEQQLNAIGIDHSTIELPEQPTNHQYEELMLETVTRLKGSGFTHAAFGDIFLDDLRKYREQQLQPHGITAVFPLWKQDTLSLMNEFIAQGFKAIVVCVNASLLPEAFAGRMLDRDFINALPAGIDPCGENGEFHTFCFDGPLFKQPVNFQKGETVYKEYHHNGETSCFWFTDLLPG